MWNERPGGWIVLLSRDRTVTAAKICQDLRTKPGGCLGGFPVSPTCWEELERSRAPFGAGGTTRTEPATWQAPHDG